MDTPEERNDIPAELAQSKQVKDAREEQAGDQLKAEVTRGEIILSAFGYVGFFCIVPLVLRPNSTFCQHHAHQALILAIGIYFFDIMNFFPAWLSGFYVFLKYGLILYSMYQALKGRMHKLPFIHDLSEKFQVVIK